MSLTDWTRTKGWKVDWVNATPYDLGEVAKDHLLTFSGDAASLTASLAGTRWDNVTCTFDPAGQEITVTGTLPAPNVQSFSIILSTGTDSLNATVEPAPRRAALPPEDGGPGRGNGPKGPGNNGPPAGGSWTAQEGS